jgi:hypothetical protein
MNRVTWRNKKNTRTPSKAFDVSDVRRVTESLLQKITPAHEATSSRDSRTTIALR